MTEHIGHDKHADEDRNGGNSRNGTRVSLVDISLLTTAASNARSKSQAAWASRSSDQECRRHFGVTVFVAASSSRLCEINRRITRDREPFLSDTSSGPEHL